MSLVVAIKNLDTIVVASDTNVTAHQPGSYGQLMALPNHCVLLMAGNIEAVRQTITATVLPRVTSSLSAAGLADLLRAALTLELVPKLNQLKGRVELIVAGIDPVRHAHQPDLYYFDSAQEFNLKIVQGDTVAAGATATAAGLLAGHNYTEMSAEQIKLLAKECLSTTKMRWPTALGNHVALGVVTPENTRVEVI